MGKIKKIFSEEELNESKLALLLVGMVAIAPICTVIFRALNIYYINISFTITKIVGYIGCAFFILKLVKALKNEKNNFIKNNNYAPLILFMCFVIWALIACFFADDMNKSFFGGTRKEGFFTYLMYGGICFLACMIKHQDKKTVCDLLISSAIVLAVLGFLDFEGKYLLFPYWDSLSSVFTNPNHYGYFLVIPVICSASLTVEKEWHLKIFYTIAYTLLVITLIDTGTSGSFIAAAISILGLLIYQLISKKKFAHIIICLVILICCTLFHQSKYSNRPLIKDISDIVNQVVSVFSNESGVFLSMVNDDLKDYSELDSEETKVARYGSGRLLIWINSAKLILKSPIVGYGMENITTEMMRLNNTSPHNLILSLGLFTGVPGACFYLFGVAIVMIVGLWNLKKMDEIEALCYFSCLGYLISSMFGTSKYYTSPFFFVFFGMVYGAWLISMTNKEESNN